MNRRLFIFQGLLAVFLIALVSLTGCSSLIGTLNTKGVVAQSEKVNVPVFAAYEDVPVSIKPAVVPYKVNPDLSNITNRSMFQISDQAKDMLVKNSFAVVPNDYREFFELYETERYEPVPLFITTDSILHNYHLFFDHLLRTIETDKLASELRVLNKAMLEQSRNQYDTLKGTGWENAAKRNTGFFAVGSKLSDNAAVVPEVIKKEAAEELKLINEHNTMAISPVMSMGNGDENIPKEDYSQYTPRGHYEKSDILRNYFRNMMWYGRITFCLKNEDELKSAVLAALALSDDQIRLGWEKICQSTGYFAGQSDDISYYQIRELLEKVYGPNANLRELTGNKEKWKAFMKAVLELKGPSINSIPLESVNQTAEEREKEIKGFRFMGQRFTVDAYILQRLVYPEVKDNRRGKMRVLPKGMDIPAVLGSKQAYNILQSEDETQYRYYEEKFERIKAETEGMDKNTWTQNLYNGWLYSLLPMLQEKTQGYPSFMLNQAWARKEINAFLGSWTELKHDTILYAKPVYAEAGGGGDNIDDRGYVEPNPYVFARLASLVKMTSKGLQEANLIDDRDKENLRRMEEMTLTLKNIAEKEINNLQLTGEDYDFIRFYGANLEHFWLEALRDEGIDHRSAIYDKPAALIADIANYPEGGSILEEATGHIFDIYVVVPVEGKLRICKGGVYSYYEFTWPINDRLTDTNWHKMLETGANPPLPLWTNMFITTR
jgi:hypothetical protein